MSPRPLLHTPTPVCTRPTGPTRFAAQPRSASARHLPTGGRGTQERQLAQCSASRQRGEYSQVTTQDNKDQRLCQTKYGLAKASTPPTARNATPRTANTQSSATDAERSGTTSRQQFQQHTRTHGHQAAEHDVSNRDDHKEAPVALDPDGSTPLLHQQTRMLSPPKPHKTTKHKYKEKRSLST